MVWFIGPCVNTSAFSAFLAAFAREIEAGPNKHIILALDQAGWHVSQDLEVPDGIELMFLPPYSPEIQPVERLWTLTDEPLANEYFQTLDDLDQVLGQRCRVLADEPDLIRAHTRFHWWPAYN